MFDEYRNADDNSASGGLLNLFTSFLSSIVSLYPLWAFIIVLLALIEGPEWYDNYIYSWLGPTVGIFMILSLLCGLIFSFPRATRAFGGFAFTVVGALMFCQLWLQCITITYGFWGRIGIIVGALLAGIGLIGTAFLASIFNGVWFNVIVFIVLFALIWGFYILGGFVMSKGEYEEDREAPPPPEYYDFDREDDAEIPLTEG